MAKSDIDWTLLRSFLAVADAGSFSAAARSLRLTQPTLGRHIKQLESQLNAVLFTRSVKGLRPTEAALELLPHTRQMASTAAALVRAASGEQQDEKGTVRIAASDVIGAEVLPEIVVEFRRIHPSIEIELVISNRNENLLQREADIAVRMVQPTQQQLLSKRIGDVPVRLYAHKTYLKRRGAPKTVEALGQHDVIGYDRDNTMLDAATQKGLAFSRNNFTLRCDHDLTQLALLRNAAGIGGMQVQLAKREKNLLPVLHEQIELPLEMWLVMHEDLRETRRIRLAFDYFWTALKKYQSGK